MRKLACFILFTFYFLLFTLYFLPTKTYALTKYHYRDRFGVGMDQHIVDQPGRNIDEFPWQDLGIGWYLDWGLGQFNNGGPRKNLAYLPLVGGWSPNLDVNFCQPVRDLIAAAPNKYPNSMVWTVGNEIGWDDNLTPTLYADYFIKWRDCLKSINSSYKVATGAIISAWHALKTDTTSAGGCVDISAQDSAQNSGKNYFLNYINRIKQIDSTKLPDVIVAHGYTHCNGGFTFDAFRQSIIETRNMIKIAGLQNRDLIIKEFGPMIDTMPQVTRQQYMQDTINFMLNYKDQNLGLAEDDYRLVQKFAWFVLNNWQGKPEYSWTTNLADTYTGQLNPLGLTYKNLINQYASTDILTRGDLDGNFLIDIYDYNMLVSNFDSTGIPGFHVADLNPNGKIDIFDYNILVGNFGAVQ